MLKRIVMVVVCSWVLCGNAQPYLLVGTYTSGASEGIYVYRFNSHTATANLLSSVKASNPSYLAVSPHGQYVYAVNENADTVDAYIGGSVTAFSFNRSTGSLTPINQQPSAGKHPCYITVSDNGKWVITGNYSSGTIAVLPVQQNGGLGAATQTVQHTGSGPNKARQQSAHVHATVLTANNSYLLVPDLGMDKVVPYHFNKKTGELTPLSTTAQTVPGSGPRHIVLSRNNHFAYLAEEMTGTVRVFSYHDGQLKTLQTLSAHPAGYDGPISSADIHLSPDGKFLYCSNRGGANNIAIFAVNAKNGLLRLVSHQSTLGLTPRNFNFDPSGNFLLVANQQSNNIVIFKVDKKTGLLTDTGNRIEVPNPVCIKWITARKR